MSNVVNIKTAPAVSAIKEALADPDASNFILLYTKKDPELEIDDDPDAFMLLVPQQPSIALYQAEMFRQVVLKTILEE